VARLTSAAWQAITPVIGLKWMRCWLEGAVADYLGSLEITGFVSLDWRCPTQHAVVPSEDTGCEYPASWVEKAAGSLSIRAGQWTAAKNHASGARSILGIDSGKNEGFRPVETGGSCVR